MISGVPRKILALRGRLTRMRSDEATSAFVRHNRSVWSSSPTYSEREVLFEYNSLCSCVLAYSYFANVLAQIHDAKIKAYDFSRRSRFVPDSTRTAFQSFNTDVFSVELTPELEAERDSIISRIGYRNLSKKELVDLVIDGIHIGDLVYDQHLREYNVPTVDPKSELFSLTLRESIGLFVYWQHYLDTHDVRAVNVSHCVYRYGIILRLAVQRDIPVYQINATHGYRLSKENLWAYDDFYYYPAKFRELGLDVKAAGLVEAEARLARRFNGEAGVDMKYSSKSAYGDRKGERVVVASPRTKVFVALHCFFDNPHPYGIGYFPDFYEWLNFLGEVSLKTDYDWYLKTHPDFLPGNRDVIQGFLDRYPKFNLVPNETSHHQLISEGIDVALTVHGTIGFEYAALGVPVVNASPCNPHVAYKFNLHPRSFNEYKSIVMNLAGVRISIDPAEVREYYYMRNIRTTRDWLFGDYELLLKEIGGYKGQFTSKSYAWFLANFTPDRHVAIRDGLVRFVESEDYCFGIQHLNAARGLSANDVLR